MRFCEGKLAGGKLKQQLQVCQMKNTEKHIVLSSPFNIPFWLAFSGAGKQARDEKKWLFRRNFMACVGGAVSLYGNKALEKRIQACSQCFYQRRHPISGSAGCHKFLSKPRCAIWRYQYTGEVKGKVSVAAFWRLCFYAMLLLMRER